MKLIAFFLIFSSGTVFCAASGGYPAGVRKTPRPPAGPRPTRMTGSGSPASEARSIRPNHSAHFHNRSSSMTLWPFSTTHDARAVPLVHSLTSRSLLSAGSSASSSPAFSAGSSPASPPSLSLLVASRSDSSIASNAGTRVSSPGESPRLSSLSADDTNKALQEVWGRLEDAELFLGAHAYQSVAGGKSTHFSDEGVKIAEFADGMVTTFINSKQRVRHAPQGLLDILRRSEKVHYSRKMTVPNRAEFSPHAMQTFISSSATAEQKL